MTIYTICPNRLIEGTWNSQKVQFADALIDYAQSRIPELRQHIRTARRILQERK
jgi:hypothetical protein